MDSLAIVIGVSEYANESNLSACSNDADIIYSILESTEKYKEILFLKGTVESSLLKEKLIEFSKKYETEEIEELFFYFSGHGCSNENDFYFCTTDIQTAKINSTSLQNTELDAFIRKIEPKLYVKVVDACYSGTHYIKGADFQKETMTASFEKAKEQKMFKNLYFLYSSRFDEQSVATPAISVFTDSFISCIKQAELSKPLRYKAIINFLTDSFNENEKQKPYFTMQADMTDTFCIITQKVLKSMEHYISLTESAQPSELSPEDTEKEKNSLKKKLEERIEKFCSEEETKKVSEEIQALFSEFTIKDAVISEYYDITITNTISEKDITDDYKIGEWINKNRRSLELFASQAYNIEIGYDSFESYVNNLCDGQLIIVSPKKQPLPKFKLVIVYIYSPYNIYIFSKNRTFYRKNWKFFRAAGSSSWNVDKIEVKQFSNSDKDVIKTILSDFEQYILESLEQYLN